MIAAIVFRLNSSCLGIQKANLGFPWIGLVKGRSKLFVTSCLLLSLSLQHLVAQVVRIVLKVSVRLIRLYAISMLSADMLYDAREILLNKE